MTDNRPEFAVLGFRPHTYWTAAVAVTGRADEPRVLQRRRIEFAGRGERFIYHQAAEADLARAPAMIEQARRAIEANAAAEIAGFVADLGRGGVLVRLAVTPAATSKLPDRLQDILQAHSRIHAAEGNFSRDAIASACAVAGLEVRRVVERELGALVGDLLGLGPAAVAARLKTMGVALGPPWSEDYKLATEAAWLHLEGAGVLT